MDSKIIQTEDYKYFIDRPDSSFNPQRNQAIIQETIKETEKFFHDTVSVLDNEAYNRIDIVSTYGRYRFNKGSMSFKDYAGKRLHSQLIGEKILSRVRVMDTVNRLSNNKKYNKFIQL